MRVNQFPPADFGAPGWSKHQTIGIVGEHHRRRDQQNHHEEGVAETEPSWFETSFPARQMILSL